MPSRVDTGDPGSLCTEECGLGAGGFRKDLTGTQRRKIKGRFYFPKQTNKKIGVFVPYPQIFVG